MYIYNHMYVCISLSLCLSLSLYIYIYIYVCIAGAVNPKAASRVVRLRDLAARGNSFRARGAAIESSVHHSELHK